MLLLLLLLLKGHKSLSSHALASLSLSFSTPSTLPLFLSINPLSLPVSNLLPRSLGTSPPGPQRRRPLPAESTALPPPPRGPRHGSWLSGPRPPWARSSSSATPRERLSKGGKTSRLSFCVVLKSGSFLFFLQRNNKKLDTKKKNRLSLSLSRSLKSAPARSDFLSRTHTRKKVLCVSR